MPIKICFFNHYHNGDLLATKEFVRELMQKVPAEYYYMNHKHPKVLGDLPASRVFLSDLAMQGIQQNAKFAFIEKDNTLMVNTWIGAYIDNIANKADLPFKIPAPNLTSEGINWKTYHGIWKYIFSVISVIIERQITLSGNPQDYAHSIDYTKFACRFELPQRDKLVLFSNGLVESGQNHINDDMSQHITHFANQYPNYKFICTRKFNKTQENILFVEDLVQNSEGCDLNEIACISEYCDVVIGRNSGPFLFTNTKANLSNPNKKFLAFGRNYGDCFPAALSFPCDFRFIVDSSQETIRQGIEDIL